ncbi:MAG: hypothetical protein RLZZ15_2838 [Verrucomicrobiota bacterium]|jgi:hypothetical protein
MFLDFLVSLLLFAIVTAGLAWPLAARLRLAPAEKILAGAALSLLGVFVFGWAVFVFHPPTLLFWLLPPLALTGLAESRRELATTWRDADARALLVAQLLVSAWCVGWLALVQSYSGGGWAGDWFEHWERAKFFLEHWPLDRNFLVTYPLTARPPLANIITGAFLRLTRTDFAHYQLVSTLLASLVFLPAAVLARRWGGLRAIAVLAVLFMVSPLFVQNATFAWTKLPAAFFALAALYFFLRTHERAPGPDTDAATAATEKNAPLLAALFAALFAAFLAAALLAHYSAGPYAVALGGAWLGLGWGRRRDAAWWRLTGLAALVGALVLALWFGWALAHYGAAGTLLTNSSATSRDVREGNQLLKIALNLRDTLVPHFLRDLDPALIAQRSTWGWLRDWFFQCYQLSFPLACGSVAWLALLWESVRAARTAPVPARRFWLWFGGCVTVLGVAAHGARDHWGLAHICLHALVLLALAWLAARWSALARPWRLALAVGATVDFVCGIALQFGVQSYALDRWLTPNRPPDEALRSYSEPAFMNLVGKVHNQLDFFGDVFPAPAPLVFALLAALLVCALMRTRVAR